MGEEPDVLIVGGSLVGLATALFLRLHGVSCLAVERHDEHRDPPARGSLPAPHGRDPALGWAGGVRPAQGRGAVPPDGGINNVESLAGREIASYFSNLNAGRRGVQPDGAAVHRPGRARADPARPGRGARRGELRYRVECASLSQDDEGVTATLRDLDGGSEQVVRSKYVVAADGNRSRIREQLGIAMRGHGLLSNSITIYFRAEVDLAPLLAGRDQGVNYVTNPVLRGFFRLDRSGNRGFLVVNLVGDTARPEVVAAYPVGAVGERRRDDHRAARARAAAGGHRGA